MSAVIAVSAEADFEAGTWTFEPKGPYAVGAGNYAIMREEHFKRLLTACRLAIKASAKNAPDGEYCPDWQAAMYDMREAEKEFSNILPAEAVAS
jgi:hypothetical protein